MEKLTPLQSAQFLRRFVFRGGKLLRFRVRNLSNRLSQAELLVRIREVQHNRPVRLRIVLDEIEEFRFQRRPNGGLVRLTEVRLGYFNDLFFLNLDAYSD